MINFNGADEQKEIGGGCIPEGSIVKVRMKVRRPSGEKVSPLDPALTLAKSGNSYLNCEFEVISGSYTGNKIWSNYTVGGNSGKVEQATNISMAFFRAALEAARGVTPSDSSPQATQARQLSGWDDFNGMEFPVKVGIDTPRVGEMYLNNTIKMAITPDKPEYQQVMSGGEIISENPLPEIPQGGQGGGQGGGQPQGGWGGQQTIPAPPPASQPVQPAGQSQQHKQAPQPQAGQHSPQQPSAAPAWQPVQQQMWGQQGQQGQQYPQSPTPSQQPAGMPAWAMSGSTTQLENNNPPL